MHDADFEPLWDIVEEHLAEADFLWEFWEQSLAAPDFNLDDVREGPERRLAAHLKGLVVNGPRVASELLVPALSEAGPGRISAAAAALLLGPQLEAGLAAVLAAVRERPAQRGPLARALAYVERPELLPRLRALLGDVDVAVVAAAAEALACHHEPLGEALSLLLAGGDPAARAVALRAVAIEPDPARHVPAVLAGLHALDPTILDAALETGARLGLAPAMTRARTRAREPDGALAMLLLAMRGTADDHTALIEALQDRTRRAAALWALGFLGTPAAVDAALEWLEDPAVGRLAGEVYTAVTGVALDAVGLALPRDDRDEALEHRPEDELPRPDPIGVLQAWWQRRGEYVEGQRYLAGAALSPTVLLQALRSGPMRRRPALLLELALDFPDERRPRLHPRAPATRQLAALTR